MQASLFQAMAKYALNEVHFRPVAPKYFASYPYVAHSPSVQLIEDVCLILEFAGNWQGMVDGSDQGRNDVDARFASARVSMSSVDDWFAREVLPLEGALMQFLNPVCETRAMWPICARRSMCWSMRPRKSNSRIQQAFVLTTARNLIINRVRRAQIIPIEAVADLETMGLAAMPGPDRAAVAEALRRVQVASRSSATAQPRSRGPQKVDGLSRREIAARMGISGDGQMASRSRNACACRHFVWRAGRPEEKTMSGAEGINAMARAEDVEACAADWLARRVSEDWNEDAQAGLNAWLTESPAHRIAFLRLNGAWSHTYRLSVLRRPGDEPVAVRKFRPLFGKAVAAFAVLAVLGAAATIYLSKPRQEIFTTATGSHETITLADGSQIELNTDTVLRTNLDANRRTVWLDRGEAYFQIKHDAARPFVVMADGHRVMDLGNEVPGPAQYGPVQVAVVEGRVRFDTAQDTPQSALRVLTPGDVIVATANATAIDAKIAAKIGNELGWRRGLLVFDHASLASVAAEFNRYNSAADRYRRSGGEQNCGRRHVSGQ